MFFKLFFKPRYKTFWMVIRKPMKGKRTKSYTSYRHYTEASAVREANRLAKKTGAPFLILKTIERVDPNFNQGETK